MALNYGTVTRVPRANIVFGPEKKPVEKKKSYTGLFRILITIAEVGALLIPGLEGAGATIGIGLAAASANTAVSASAGQVSGLSVGLDFASALLPGIGAARTGARTAKNLSSELFATTKADFIEAKQVAFATEEKLVRKTFINRKTSIRQAFKNADGSSKSVITNLRASANTAADYDAAEVFMKFKKGTATPAEYAAASLSFDLQSNLAELAAKYYVKTGEVEAVVERWENIFEKLSQTKRSKLTSSYAFDKELRKVTTHQKTYEELRKLYLPLQQKRYGRVSAAFQRQRADKAIKDVKALLSPDANSLIEGVVANYSFIRRTAKMGRAVDSEIEALYGTLKAMYPADYAILERMGTKEVAEFFKAIAVVKDKSFRGFLRGVAKKVGSKDFNEKIVQNAQLIDPNDAGRALPELVYRKMKAKIDKYFSNKAYKRAWKAANKAAQAESDIVSAFERVEGASIFPSTRYIIGIRVLPSETKIETPYTKKVVIVRFNKENTNNKSDITIFASNKDIERLILEGTGYWFAVGKKKGWFASRGGKRVKKGFGVLSNEASLFLSFVPIPALRNMLSIVSNWVENTHDIVKGTYFKDWWAKFTRAFLRTSINRSGRLLTKTVAGGAAISYTRGGKPLRAFLEGEENKAMSIADSKGYDATSIAYNDLVQAAKRKAGKKGQWIGRELQRLSTAFLSSVEGTNKNGYFKFVGTTKSGAFGKRFVKKYTQSSIPTAIRGSTIRKGTASGKTGGRQLIGARRNFGQLGRIYSAVTPTGVKPLRSLTKIKF